MTAGQIQLAVAAVAVAVAFIASVWVQAMSRLATARAERLSVDFPRRGALLVRISENPRPYLAAALLVMLGARVTATVMVAALMLEWRIPLGEVIAILAVTFLLFQVAEIAPRSWVLERPDQVMLLSARPVYGLGTLLRPVVSALIKLNRLFLLILPGRGLPKSPLTSEEEIMSMLAMAESEEVIETQERELIHSIFEFGDTVVREVMVPRPDMVCVDARASLESSLEIALGAGFSRMPVIRGDIDGVVGVVHVRDLMRRLHNGSDRPRMVADLAREATFVPESKKVAELLREMQKAKTQMAIVVDEYGGTAGLVTMEDLLEEIVGEISDEYDREEPAVEQVDPTTLRVPARLDIDELSELLSIRLPNLRWDSVGGLVGGLLGRVPVEGDRVRHDGIEFEVEIMKGRRIDKVLVHRVGAEAEGASAEGGG